MPQATKFGKLVAEGVKLVTMNFTGAGIIAHILYALSGFLSLFYLAFLVFAIYCLVLFIRLANRGIKAFDLYIKEKEEEHKS